MVTIGHSLWLVFSCDERALFSSNDQALPARCPRHIQSVFKMILDILMDINVMVNWQLSKRVSTDQCHLSVSWLKCTTRWGVTCFFKVICWPIVALKWSQWKGHIINNLLTSSVSSLPGNLRRWVPGLTISVCNKITALLLVWVHCNIGNYFLLQRWKLSGDRIWGWYIKSIHSANAREMISKIKGANFADSQGKKVAYNLKSWFSNC